MRALRHQRNETVPAQRWLRETLDVREDRLSEPGVGTMKKRKPCISGKQSCDSAAGD
jgi:hypothetical protein